MKKLVFLLLILMNFISCKVKPNDSNNDEYLNLHQIFSQLNFTEINLISEPDNTTVLKYGNGGFQDEEYNVYNYKFHFDKDKAIKWDNKLALKNKKLQKHLNFTKNKSHIPKIEFNVTLNSKVFYSVSNVMFCDNKKYAIVNIDSFSNLPAAQYFEDYLLIFKKENDEWVFAFEIMTGIS